MIFFGGGGGGEPSAVCLFSHLREVSHPPRLLPVTWVGRIVGYIEISELPRVPQPAVFTPLCISFLQPLEQVTTNWVT